MEGKIQEQIPRWVQRLGQMCKEKVFPLYIVGGFVRNALLGIPISDMDVAGPAPPEDLMAALQDEKNIRIIPKALKFGTVEIHIHMENRWHSCEYTTFRKDFYGEGGSHVPEKVTFTPSLYQDALRRDFTVNALYYELDKGRLHDPLGGMEHIRQRLICTTQDPMTVFQDDGLRLLRMLRFACELKFSIERATYETAREKIILLKDISMERIRDEFVKILLSDSRYPDLPDYEGMVSHRRGLYGLYDLGAFPYIIPQLLEGVGMEQRKEYHAYDVFHHNLEASIAMPAILHLRLAGLLHDIGKPFLQRKTGNMYGHDILGATMVQDILGSKGLKFDNKTVEKVALLVRHHMYDLDNRAKSSTVRKKFISLGLDRARDLIRLRGADQKASGLSQEDPPMLEKWERVLEELEKGRIPLSMKDLQISGWDIMEITGLGSSKKIGRIKKALFDWVIDHPEDNEPAVLKQRLREIMERDRKKRHRN
ncbi:MAG: CCA tRNA nucleotidyltransferase [Clostridia bacterium]|jgi:tRNA nucleotidyltransferase (CCA-adding enzyme)